MMPTFMAAMAYNYHSEQNTCTQDLLAFKSFIY